MKNSLLVDNFAGGGGASTGIELALGRAVDIAINHDEEAIRMHEVNHPGTKHIRNNIWQIDPREVTEGKHVGLAWFSPDCKHFSKAKGGKPREKSIRDLAWVVVLWAQRVKPDAILLENVEEFRTWGPLCDEGKPIKERAGETFEKWTKELRKAGYRIQWKELRACDYGAPTIRKRFFMIARRDGQPIVWPEPTHGKPGSPEVLSGKRKPWRAAADIIDWSIPCPSIFDRKKPLAEKTLRRIAHGIMKFVVNNPSPFIVPLTHHGSDGRSYGLDNPLPTVTGANRGEMALVSPHITKFRSGAIGHDMADPLATVTANSYIKRPGGSAPLGIVEAVLSHADFHCTACGEENGGTWWPTCEWCGHEHGEAALAPIITYAQQGGANRSAEDPLHTVCASKKDQNCIAVAMLERQFGKSMGADPNEPMPTITAGGGGKTAAVLAFMQKFAQNGQGYEPTDPLHTVMAGAPRHAVVCAHIEQANGGPNNENLAGRAADAPLSTVATAGSQQRLVTTVLEMVGNPNARIGSGSQSYRDGDDRCPLGRDDLAHRQEREGADCAAGTGQGRMPPEERLSRGSYPLRQQATYGAGASLDLDGAAGGDPSRPGYQPLGRGEGEQLAHQFGISDEEHELAARLQDGIEEASYSASSCQSIGSGEGTSISGQELPGDRGGARGGTDDCISSGQRVAAFITKYYGSEHNGQHLSDPLHTVTHQDRFGLVTVSIEGEEYVIVDIGMRMLSPRELFNAQGFPADYIIDVDAHGKPITKTAQVAKCGNSVCPPLAKALVRANCSHLMSEQAGDMAA